LAIQSAAPGLELSHLDVLDAVRRAQPAGEVTVGMIAHVSGDGFVVAQDPPAGTPIERDAVCRLTLERWPHRAVTANHP